VAISRRGADVNDTAPSQQKFLLLRPNPSAG
jgi:hypothetical protein